jgi:hypothetical protein
VKAAHTLSIGALNVLSIISFFFFISWPRVIYPKRSVEPPIVFLNI